jgi:hypothetical protein
MLFIRVKATRNLEEFTWFFLDVAGKASHRMLSTMFEQPLVTDNYTVILSRATRCTAPNTLATIRQVEVEEEHLYFVRGSAVASEFLLIVLYYDVRPSLLVLALFILRAPPYNAYAAPLWTSFIMHVN